MRIHSMPACHVGFGRFRQHQVSTARDMGWSDLDNGELLDAMTGKFDLLVTVDKGLPKQQHLRNRPFGILLLRARWNRLADLLTLAPEFETALERVRAGMVVEIERPGAWAE